MQREKEVFRRGEAKGRGKGAESRASCSTVPKRTTEATSWRCGSTSGVTIANDVFGKLHGNRARQPGAQRGEARRIASDACGGRVMLLLMLRVEAGLGLREAARCRTLPHV